MINKKKNFIYSISSLVLLAAFGYLYLYLGCDSSGVVCQDVIETTQTTFFMMVVYSSLSLSLLLLPNHYFTTWWKFARIGLPLALAAVVYVNLTFTSGYMSWGTGFDLLIIGAIYGLFILGSLISVAYVWMKARR